MWRILMKKALQKSKICLITGLFYFVKNQKCVRCKEEVYAAQRNVTMSSSSRYFFGVMP